MTIKIACAVLSLLVVIVATKSQDQRLFGQRASSEWANHVNIKLRLTEKRVDRWVFEMTASNIGSSSVFIMTDAVRDDSSKGAYVIAEHESPAWLEISSRLFPPSPYCTLTGTVHVTLQRLDPGASYTTDVEVPLPPKETTPPYRNPLDARTIDSSNIRYVKASIGVLPDEEGIRDFLKHKEGIGPYASGREDIKKGAFSGKSLFELQSIASSQPVAVTF